MSTWYNDLQWAKCPQYLPKVADIGRATGMNPSQLVEVYNAWEEKKTKQATILIDSTRGNQRGGTRDKTEIIKKDQCAYYEEEGHGRKNAQNSARATERIRGKGRKEGHIDKSLGNAQIQMMNEEAQEFYCSLWSP